MSADPEPPDWAIRAFPGVRQKSTSTLQVEGLPQTRLDQFTAWNQNVAGKDELAAGSTPVAGSSISGTVQTNSVGIAPATAVSIKESNMLVAQNFTASNTVVADGHWSWSGEDGNITAGCAVVVCDGTQDDLVSNEIPVIPGENIEVACQVKWEDITYDGTTPIKLGIEKYRQARDATTNGVTFLDIGGADIDWLTSPAADGAWGEGELAGTYVVPAGVDQLRFRFSAKDVTDGIVKWDEALFLKLDLIDDAAVPGVGQTVDAIVTNLYGQEGEGFSHNDEAVALAATAAAITSTSSTVAQLDAQQSTGSIAGDDFAYSGELIASTKWGGTTPEASNYPYYIANGSVAVWDTTGRNGLPINTEFKSSLDWQGTSPTSSTDYQKIHVVLSSGMNSYAAVSGRLYLYGRISADWQNYIELELAAYGNYRLNCNVGGTKTTLTSGSWTNSLGAGSTVTLYCGDKDTTAPLAFKAQVNGSNLFTYTDGGTSTYGATKRKWGFGGSGMYTPIPFGGYAWMIAPSVNQWTGADQ